MPKEGKPRARAKGGASRGHPAPLSREDVAALESLAARSPRGQSRRREALAFWIAERDSLEEQMESGPFSKDEKWLKRAEKYHGLLAQYVEAVRGFLVVRGKVLSRGKDPDADPLVTRLQRNALDLVPRMDAARRSLRVLERRMAASDGAPGRERPRRRVRGPVYPPEKDEALVRDWKASDLPQEEFERDREGLELGDVRKATARIAAREKYRRRRRAPE